MSKSKPTFEQKRIALCYCCGGWQNSSRSVIETRWGQLPEKRAASYLHRVEKLQKGSDDDKKQYQAFVKSLPALPAEESAEAEEVEALQAPETPEPTTPASKPGGNSSSKK